MDISKINVAVLEQNYNDFHYERTIFQNVTYSTFKSSYFRTCNDDLVSNMATKLNDCYSAIERNYNMVMDWWKKYLYDTKCVENGICMDSSTIATNERSIDGYFRSNLAPLPEYDKNKYSMVSITLKPTIQSPVSLSKPPVGGSLNAKPVNNQNITKKLDKSMFKTKIYTPEERKIQFDKYYKEAKELLVGTDYETIDDETLRQVIPAYAMYAQNKNEIKKEGYTMRGLLTNAIDRQIRGQDTIENAKEFLEDLDLSAGEWTTKILSETGAQGATMCLGMAEGAVNTGENIFDTFVMAGALLNDTGTYSLKLLSGDWNAKFGEAMDAAKEIIKFDASKKMFDALYDTSAGETIVENTKNFDEMRSIYNQLGEVGATVAISAVTPFSLATVAGVSGIGGGMEKSYNEGASTSEGIWYGLANGASNYVAYGVGAKINTISPFKSEVANSFTRVALDTLDGFAESFISPATSLIYQKGYTDENGEYHEYDGSFFERYSQSFDAQGGWASVAQQTIMAGGMSAFGEASGLAKHFAEKSKSKADLNSKIDIDSSIAKTESLSMNDFKYSSNNNLQYMEDYLSSNLKKYVYSNTNNFAGLNDSIMNKGLYHFTTDSAADAILDSGYIKNSGILSSYGNKKTFFFNGVPEVGAFATNLDDVPLKTVAIKVDPGADIVSSSKLNIRNLDDHAISWDGNFDLSGSNATKEYFCLFKEGDELVYKEVSKEFYDSYDVTTSALALSNLLSDKKNIKTIKSDYLSKLSKGNLDDLVKIKEKIGSNTIEKIKENTSKLFHKKDIDNLNNDIETLYVEESALFGENSIFNKIFKRPKYDIDLRLTAEQRNLINTANNLSKYGEMCLWTVNGTSQISSAMLNEIDDLSRLQVQVLDGLGNGNGALKLKYYNEKYINRTTYTGLQMKLIIEKIEDMQSMVDMKLPIAERAKQIYEILSSEIPPMYDYESRPNGHLVSASLRGLTDFNETGKQGLVCAGYASVYKELCERSGIKCDYVRGKAYADPLRNGKPGGHAWNVVYTENGLIPVDVTWHVTKLNGKENWFGSSNEFIAQHISDADESHKDFSTMISELAFKSSSEKLDSIFNTLEYKYGGKQQAIEKLEKYLNTQELTAITRDGGAREMISTIDYNTVKNYMIDMKIEDAISTMDLKFGNNGYGIRVLKDYLQTNNAGNITRMNNARQTILSLDKVDIERYLQKLGE